MLYRDEACMAQEDSVMKRLILYVLPVCLGCGELGELIIGGNHRRASRSLILITIRHRIRLHLERGLNDALDVNPYVWTLSKFYLNRMSELSRKAWVVCQARRRRNLALRRADPIALKQIYNHLTSSLRPAALAVRQSLSNRHL